MCGRFECRDIALMLALLLRKESLGPLVSRRGKSECADFSGKVGSLVKLF
jgi:hypothetical protein